MKRGYYTISYCSLIWYTSIRIAWN
jgi:hypothetical protein